MWIGVGYMPSKWHINASYLVVLHTYLHSCNFIIIKRCQILAHIGFTYGTYASTIHHLFIMETSNILYKFNKLIGNEFIKVVVMYTSRYRHCIIQVTPFAKKNAYPKPCPTEQLDWIHFSLNYHTSLVTPIHKTK